MISFNEYTLYFLAGLVLLVDLAVIAYYSYFKK